MRKLKSYRGLRALLARGKRELTFPRWIASGVLAQALVPGFMGRQVRRNTIDALARMNLKECCIFVSYSSN